MTMAPIDNLPEWLAASIRAEADRRGATPTMVLAETAVAFDQWRSEIGTDGKLVGAQPVSAQPIDGGVDADFLAHVDSTIERFKPVLDQLAAT